MGNGLIKIINDGKNLSIVKKVNIYIPVMKFWWEDLKDYPMKVTSQSDNIVWIALLSSIRIVSFVLHIWW